MGIMAGLGLIKTILDVKRDLDSSTPPGEVAKRINEATKHIGLVMTDGSITKLVSQTIIEPIAIVSKDLRQEDIIQKVLELNTDIFTGFYMQAYEILKNLYGVNSQTVVKLLGTDNSSLVGLLVTKGGGYIAGKAVPSAEELMTEEFDFFSDLQNGLKFTMSIEAKGDNDNNMKTSRPSLDSKSTSDDNLSGILQRQVELVIDVGSDGDTHKIILPMTIKTHVIFTDVDSIIRLLTPNAYDKSFGYRLDEYRSGAISLTDLVFATDLIKEYKQNKLADKDGLITLLNRRTESGNSKMVATKGIAGFEKNYNMFVITAYDQVKIEKQLHGKLANEVYKQKFLEQGGGLLVTIIDQDHERILMYTRDIRGTSDLSFRALQKRNAKSNDFEEIIKAILTNRPPVF
jgi:hypothetical protein